MRIKNTAASRFASAIQDIDAGKTRIHNLNFVRTYSKIDDLEVVAGPDGVYHRCLIVS